MSREETILTAIGTTLAAVTGLSSSAVVEGIPTPGDLRPGMAYYTIDTITSTRDGASLTEYKHEAEFNIIVAVPADGSTPGARVRAALAMASLIRRALETNYELGGNGLDVSMDWTSLDGDQFGVPGAGIALGLLTAWWLSDQGGD